MNPEPAVQRDIPREFEEVTISVPWGHIAGCWYGKKNTRPILALHGWLDNYCTWDTLIPLMPSHIGVLAIDMAGHGKSSRRPAGEIYNGLSYVADIIRLMKHFNWDKVSIMAHSMSSIVAFMFAAFYPDRVDMLIQLDTASPKILSLDYIMWKINSGIESFLIEEKRIQEAKYNKPPSYSYTELIQRIHEGSNKSVDKDKCKHLIPTNVSKSTLYPSKYYFSRDPRIKSYQGFVLNQAFIVFMAKRIKIPQIVIKASESNAIGQHDPIIQILQDNNPYFEFHILQGTHHVHLNNAPDTSILINTFINKWRPLTDVVVAGDIPVGEVKPQPQIFLTKPQDGKLHVSKL